MRYPQLAVGVFLAMIAVLIPLPRLWRAHNIPCLAMLFWLFQHNLISFVNSLIWDGNVNNSAPVWCDISESLPLPRAKYLHTKATLHIPGSANKLQAGAGIALPATTLCLASFLEVTSRGQPVNPRFRLRFDLAMCVGLPIIWMFLGMCYH
jgi:pheromone a factor receptor